MSECLNRYFLCNAILCCALPYLHFYYPKAANNGEAATANKVKTANKRKRKSIREIVTSLVAVEEEEALSGDDRSFEKGVGSSACLAMHCHIFLHLY